MPTKCEKPVFYPWHAWHATYQCLPARDQRGDFTNGIEFVNTLEPTVGNVRSALYLEL